MLHHTKHSVTFLYRVPVRLTVADDGKYNSVTDPMGARQLVLLLST
jgi:hypothetical protein